MRPDNLAEDLPGEAAALARVLRARDDDPGDLAATLWDLPGWSETGRQLLREMDRAAGIPERFTVAAAMVRHLLTDPVLPAELLPADWPADELRAAYADFAAELASRHDELTLTEAR